MEKVDNDGLTVKVKVTKKLYKAYDSYKRRERWIAKTMIEEIKKLAKMDM